MSQYHYMFVHKGKKTEVFMGWDRPLQGFFLVIDQGGEEPLWSNLDQEVSHPNSLTPFLVELNNRGINAPESMISELLEDQRQNVGNKNGVYWSGGRVECNQGVSNFNELCEKFL